MKKLTEAQTKEDVQQSFVEIIEYVDEEDADYKKRVVVPWLISFVVHAVIIGILSLLIISQHIEKDEPATQIVTLEVIEQIEIKKPIDLIENREIDLKIEEEAEVPNPILSETLEIITESEDNMEDSVNNGREEAVSTSELGGQGMFAMIGAGGGPAGMYGNRGKSGKQKAIGKYGDKGRQVESAINSGLRWLKRHQSIDGKWEADNYWMNCTEAGPKCEPGVMQAGDTNVAMTGYAILCFLGAGYDHRMPSQYRQTVLTGLNWLKSQQNPDGTFGPRNYEHSVATQAMAEAYGMSKDLTLKDPTQKALDVLISRQAKNEKYEYGLGWDYTKQNINRNDTSIIGWAAMALKSAQASGLNVGNSMHGVEQWLDATYAAANPNWKNYDPYVDTATFPYTWNAETNATSKDHLSFVGAVCAVFLGRKLGDTMLETMLNDCEKRWIDSGKYKDNHYASYYVVMAEFQAGNKRWEKCLNTIIPHLLEMQDKNDNCFNGSFPYDTQKWHGSKTGRVLSTVYCILNLEVAFRYTAVMEK